MRHLLNTLFVTSEDIYLSLDGENVVASREKAAMARYPLHTLSAIITFAYPGASPALMGACAQRGIALERYQVFEQIADAIFAGRAKEFYPEHSESDSRAFAQAIRELKDPKNTEEG